MGRVYGDVIEMRIGIKRHVQVHRLVPVDDIGQFVGRLADDRRVFRTVVAIFRSGIVFKFFRLAFCFLLNTLLNKSIDLITFEAHSRTFLP